MNISTEPLFGSFDAAVNNLSPQALLNLLTRFNQGDSRLRPETADRLAEAYQRRQREAQP